MPVIVRLRGSGTLGIAPGPLLHEVRTVLPASLQWLMAFALPIVQANSSACHELLLAGKVSLSSESTFSPDRRIFDKIGHEGTYAGLPPKMWPQPDGFLVVARSSCRWLNR